MTTESFAEFLNKLKEIHEKEVQGLQSKLTELTTEKCRDAQRIEELFAKNHQLREQQKVLKENVKVLENRLRAGLCDRCMVTQELAKKKQNEYESSHLQRLQHIFILSNETNRLREENKTLKEELKRLRSLEDRTKHSAVTSRESSCTPSSPLPLLSPVSRNASPEKAAHRGAEEVHHNVLGIELGEEKPAEQRRSPSSRTSPGTVLQEVSLAEMASQMIANQLHGTIALVRPGSRPCLLEKSPSGTAVSPPARKTPLPLERDHSPSLEDYLTGSTPDSPKVAPSYETLKLTTRREQFCLLHKHLSLHQLGLARNCASDSRDGSSFSSHLLRAKDTDGRTQPCDGWEDRAALLKLPATMVYVRDQQLEEKLHLLKHRERLQHFLMQQCQLGQRADGDSKLMSEERPLSLWPSITPGCKEERSLLEDAADGKEEKELWLSQDCSKLQEKAKMPRDDGADVPLDLSDSGRGREAGWQNHRESQGAGSPRLSLRESPAVLAAHGPCGRAKAEQDYLCFPYHWPNTTRALPGAAKEEEDAAVAHPRNNSTPSDPEVLPETRARLAASAPKGEAGEKPQANMTFEKARAEGTSWMPQIQTVLEKRPVPLPSTDPEPPVGALAHPAEHPGLSCWVAWGPPGAKEISLAPTHWQNLGKSIPVYFPLLPRMPRAGTARLGSAQSEGCRYLQQGSKGGCPADCPIPARPRSGYGGPGMLLALAECPARSPALPAPPRPARLCCCGCRQGDATTSKAQSLAQAAGLCVKVGCVSGACRKAQSGILNIPQLPNLPVPMDFRAALTILRVWTGGFASAQELVRPPTSQKSSSFCVSLDDDDDDESGKQESDEPDTTDSEGASPCEDDILQEAQADAKYFCTKDKAHVLQKKRKRGQDPWTKGAKKPTRGRKKVKVEQCSAGVMQEPENHRITESQNH
ncbi:RBBP8 N-terminal-like protein [Rhynochetos jubatus]